jgi:hypothetical protein
VGEDLRRFTLMNPDLRITMEYDRETNTFTAWTPKVESIGSVISCEDGALRCSSVLCCPAMATRAEGAATVMQA